MKKYVVDGLSLLRIIAIFPIVIFAAKGEWNVACGILIGSWIVDMLDVIPDGLWGSTHPQVNFDRCADMAVVYATGIVPVIYLWQHVSATPWPAVLATALYLAAVTYGVTLLRMLQKKQSVAVMAKHLVMTAGVLTISWFAIMATHDKLAGVAIIVIAISAVIAMEKKASYAV